MKLNDLLTREREEILRTAAQYGATNVRLFGSAARGEAAKWVDADYRAEHPDIPWRSMAGLRNVLIHQYPHQVGACLGRCRE